VVAFRPGFLAFGNDSVPVPSLSLDSYQRLRKAQETLFGERAFRKESSQLICGEQLDFINQRFARVLGWTSDEPPDREIP
jgi:hypothetical protein